jgi:hypothetical protein
MTGRHRPPRRQGVVYGPLVTRDQREPGSVVGRLLGGIVIFGALAVLAVGALAVIGGNATPDATPSATPTLAGLPSPTPSPTGLPTTTLLPTPTPTLVPTASPSATPFPVELVEGRGKITFATSYTTGLVLINKTVDFGPTGPIAWRANIGDPVGSVRLDFQVSRVNPADLTEVITHHTTFTPGNPSATLYYSKSRVERLTDGPGIYVMRYLNNGAVISEGYFRVSA